jgi:hypothetical protein
MENYYKVKGKVWQAWPLKPKAGYMQGDTHGFINYNNAWLREDLREELVRLNLIEHTVLSVFYTAPNSPVPIHVDGFNALHKRRANAAINWTWTVNPNDAWRMVWYNFPTNPDATTEIVSQHIIKNKNGIEESHEYSYTRFNESLMEKSDETTWSTQTNPMLIRTNVPHNIVIDQPNTARWCASIRFGFEYDGSAIEDFDKLKNMFEQVYK